MKMDSPFYTFDLSQSFGVYAKLHEGDLIYSSVEKVEMGMKKLFPSLVELNESQEVMNYTEVLDSLSWEQEEALAVEVFII